MAEPRVQNSVCTHGILHTPNEDGDEIVATVTTGSRIGPRFRVHATGDGGTPSCEIDRG